MLLVKDPGHATDVEGRAVRRDHRCGMAMPEIERKYNVSWRTVRKAVDSVWPEPRKKLPPRPTALDAYKPVVDGISCGRPRRGGLKRKRPSRSSRKGICSTVLITPGKQLHLAALGLARDGLVVGELEASCARDSHARGVPRFNAQQHLPCAQLATGVVSHHLDSS